MGLVVFTMDATTAHPGVTVDHCSALRETSGGWVTIKSSTPLTPDNHQWAVKIVDQGEGNDASGLMVGLLPKLSSSVASSGMASKFISELGGWCLSRGGESYGTWKCDKVPFGTGSVVEFDLDVGMKTLYVVHGKAKASAHIPTLGDCEELYPAVSLYYLNQKVTFV